MSFLSPEILAGGDWRALERAITRLMGHSGWKEVSTVGQTGDRGADIVAVRSSKGKALSWVVQVKAVTGANYVGPEALQQVTDALSAYGSQVAAVATNGNFTDAAFKYRDRLIKSGFEIKTWNGTFLKDLLNKCPADHPRLISLHPYQKEIHDKIVELFDSKQESAQFIVATGLGKTAIASWVTRTLLGRGVRRVLVLCHAGDLALQLEEAFWRQLPKSVATRVFSDGEPPLIRDGVNFGLYQTLISYLPSLSADAFDLIIVDEAHHALGNQFRKCIEHFRPKFKIAMTATPWRGDGALIDDLFGPPIAKLSLVDGMKKGALANVDYRIMCDNIDWAEIPKLTRGNLSIRDLNKRLFLPQRDEAAIYEVDRAVKLTPNPKIAIFSPSIEHSTWFARMLKTHNIAAESLSDCDKVERRKRLLAFATGQLQAVTAVDVLNEGIDIPDLNILVFMRATHSRRIFVQQLGRGLRLAPNKTKVLVLDFVSDIRRMAEIYSIKKEIVAAQKPQNIHLKQQSVEFSNKRAESFIEAWLSDIGDLSDTDESEKLKFPEGIF